MDLSYTSSAGTIDFVYPFRVTSIGGLGNVDAEMQTQKAPNQDGSTYIKSFLNERVITVELKVFGLNEGELSKNRRKLASIINPKKGISKVKITIQDEVFVCDVVADFVPKFSDVSGMEGRVYHFCLLQLTANNPYWYSENEKLEQLVTFSGGLTFPLILPTIFGNQDPAAKSRIVINEGDAPTPIEVTFEGPATSPIRIENETIGSFIEINQNLLEGEKLIINTQFGNKRVDKILVDGTKTNAFNYIKIDPIQELSSTFFELEPGNNLLTYSTGADFEKAPVTIKFYPRYSAI